MADARPISPDALLADLAAVLGAVRGGAVYRVSTGGGDGFVLAPPELGGQVLGLYDPEYGWPADVDAASVRSAADLAPGPRRHPFIRDAGGLAAVALGPEEYAEIRRRPADPGPAAP